MKCVKSQGKIQRVSETVAAAMVKNGAVYANKVDYKDANGKGPATTPKASWNQK